MTPFRIKMTQKQKLVTKFLFASLLVLLSFPGMIFAAGGGSESGSSTMEMIFKIINFVVLASVLIYFARKPVLAFLSSDRKKRYDEFVNPRDTLNKLMSELESTKKRMGELEQELSDYRNNALLQAEKEKNDLIVSAEETSERILKSIHEKQNILLNDGKFKIHKEILESAIQEIIEELKKDPTQINVGKLVKQIQDKV